MSGYPDKTESSHREHDDTASPSLTLRDALRLIWQAAKYPILGNEDWRAAERMDREVLEQAAMAVRGPDDPPEFATWIAALRDPKLHNDEREDILSAIYDMFELPED